MRIIRELEIFALFASSKKTRKIGSELHVSERLTRKLQARELPGWMIPRKFHAADYRHFTVYAKRTIFELCVNRAL